MPNIEDNSAIPLDNNTQQQSDSAAKIRLPHNNPFNRCMHLAPEVKMDVIVHGLSEKKTQEFYQECQKIEGHRETNKQVLVSPTSKRIYVATPEKGTKLYAYMRYGGETEEEGFMETFFQNAPPVKQVLFLPEAYQAQKVDGLATPPKTAIKKRSFNVNEENIRRAKKRWCSQAVAMAKKPSKPISALQAVQQAGFEIAHDIPVKLEYHHAQAIRFAEDEFECQSPDNLFIDPAEANTAQLISAESIIAATSQVDGLVHAEPEIELFPQSQVGKTIIYPIRSKGYQQVFRFDSTKNAKPTKRDSSYIECWVNKKREDIASKESAKLPLKEVSSNLPSTSSKSPKASFMGTFFPGVENLQTIPSPLNQQETDGLCQDEVRFYLKPKKLMFS